MIGEWFDENMMLIGIVGTSFWSAIIIYLFVAIKYNLLLPNWIKNISELD